MTVAPTQKETEKETEKNTERAEQTLSDPGYGENERKERAYPRGVLASLGYGESERKEKAEPARGDLASPGNAERLLGCGVGGRDDDGQS